MPGLLDMLNAGEDPLATVGAGGVTSGGFGNAGGGLLSAQDQQNARRQALLAGAAQLMSAGGWSPQRTTFGQALGPAILAGQSAQSQAINNSLQQALIAKQLREKKADLVAVIGPDGKPQYIEASKAAGKQPYNMSPEAKDTAPIQEYNLYATQMKAAGQQPIPYMDFLQKRAAANAQYPYAVGEIGSVPSLINRTYGGLPAAPGAAPPQPTTRPLSTLPAETGGRKAIKGAEAEGTKTGEATAENQVGLNDALTSNANMRDQVQSLLNEPGFDTIYGMSGKFDPRNYFAGTDASNAAARRAQLDAMSFGITIQKMRGLGALSDAEGRKVTAAFTRATNPSLSADAARSAWQEVLQRLDTADQQARQKASGNFTEVTPAAQTPAAKVRRYNPATGKIE